MNSDRIKEFIDKVPFGFLVFAYLGYLGFDYYSFENDPSSLKIAKIREIETARDNKLKLEAKYKELNLFIKSLEQKKIEIRSLAQELQGVKGSLSETLDKAAFIKMVGTEAKRVGLLVTSSQPGATVLKEYYAEQNFSFVFKGVFVQIIAFLDRISNVTQIIHSDRYAFKPTGRTISGKFPEMEAEVELKTYQYVGTKADAIPDEGKANGGENSSSNSKASSPAGTPAGEAPSRSGP